MKGPEPEEIDRAMAKPTTTAKSSDEVQADTTVEPSSSRCICGEELVRIDLLIDGEELTMCSCSNCDRRSWHRGGEEVALDGVLADLSSVPTRYRPRSGQPLRSPTVAVKRCGVRVTR